jgi:hypothetical protein
MNPMSTTMIKCDLWAGTITPSIALNDGQMRSNFHVVMAGSNAYVKDIVGDSSSNSSVSSVPAGYTVEKYANGAAITAPLDCHGVDTYMGVMYWTYRDASPLVNRQALAIFKAVNAALSTPTCSAAMVYHIRSIAPCSLNIGPLGTYFCSH